MKIRDTLWAAALLAFPDMHAPAATLYVDLNSTALRRLERRRRQHSVHFDTRIVFLPLLPGGRRGAG